MPSPCVYEVALRHRAGPLDLDVRFRLDAPWTVLFAPSGAGKTTVLRMIAGLERPDAGRIVCHQAGYAPHVLCDTATRVELPTHLRAIRMVAQRPALFPHLSVLKNVVYRMQGGGLDRVLALCRIEHLTGKMPAQLSGGERQRVALARAIAAGGGRLMMLDEPFSGLEAELRDALIDDLRSFFKETETPVLMVTHDLGEVFAAQAHVLKMEGGRIVASEAAGKVLAVERERLIQQLQRQHGSNG